MILFSDMFPYAVIYFIVCTLLLFILYFGTVIYVVKNDGDKRLLITNLPSFLKIYIEIIVGGVLAALFGGIAYTGLFMDVKNEQVHNIFFVLMGICMVYTIGYNMIIQGIKKGIYPILSSCVKKYNE